MADELAGKVAIVTGGASGIGAAMVEKFLAEGARVLVADIDRERGEEFAAGLGSDAVFRPADVALPEQMEELVAAAVDTFGGLDVMVNNAGIPSPMYKSFLYDDLADFHRVMAVNVLGVMAGTKYAARHMRTGDGGSIINISSIGGVQAGGGVMTYRASKAAVLHFTKCAAIELAHYDIRVNCIAPGNIPTPLLASAAKTMAGEAADQFVKATREVMRNDRPLKREGTPADVAEAALYFAGDRSAYVTGTVLPVDGGTVAGKVIRRHSDSQTPAADTASRPVP